MAVALFCAAPSIGLAAGPSGSGARSSVPLNIGHAHIMPRATLVQATSTASSYHLSYQGGPVMHSFTAYLDFWLPKGFHFESAYDGQAANAKDQGYESLIQQFFQKIGGTRYFNLLTQYSDRSAQIPNHVVFGGAYVDTTAFPHAGTQADPLQDADIQASAQRAQSSLGTPVDLAHEYFVFTPFDVQSCLDSTDCSYNVFCAYHGNFRTSSNAPFLYANMFDAGTYIDNGCGTAQQVNNDPIADDEIQITSHEMAETITDPLVGEDTLSWYDLNANMEIGDICVGDTAVISLHGHNFEVQQLYSNTQGACSSDYIRPDPLTVNSALDSPASSSAPLCPNTPGGDSGSTTAYILRCAIGDADNDYLADPTVSHHLTFSVPAGQCNATSLVCTITPASRLPSISAGHLTLDGTTQSGATAGHPTIELKGSSAATVGLDLTGSNDTVQGLDVVGFSQAGITIEGASNTAQNDVIGDDPSGAAVPNGDGVLIQGSQATGNVVGLTTKPNTIRDNTGFGVQVGASSTDAATATIRGNSISGNGAGGIDLMGMALSSCPAGTGSSADGGIACPTISAANSSSGVSGSSSCHGCSLDVYDVGGTADPSGHGQAKKFVGTASTTSTGSWTLPTSAFQSAVGSGDLITATVTGTSGTSEFAANVAYEVPTASRVAGLTVARQGSWLTIRWRLADHAGVAGFNVYVAKHRLNRHLIPVHAGSTYRFHVRWTGSGPYRLTVVLRDGQQLSVRAS